MRKLLVVPLVCALLWGAGCNKVTYVNPTLPPNGIVHEGTGHFFIFALVGEEHIPVYQMCPGGAVSRIQTKFSFGDLFLTVITFGIYTPRSWEVDCGGMR